MPPAPPPATIRAAGTQQEAIRMLRDRDAHGVLSMTDSEFLADDHRLVGGLARKTTELCTPPLPSGLDEATQLRRCGAHVAVEDPQTLGDLHLAVGPGELSQQPVTPLFASRVTNFIARRRAGVDVGSRAFFELSRLARLADAILGGGDAAEAAAQLPVDDAPAEPAALRRFVDYLRGQDPNGLFWYPVSDHVLPGYHASVRTPVALSDVLQGIRGTGPVAAAEAGAPEWMLGCDFGQHGAAMTPGTDGGTCGRFRRRAVLDGAVERSDWAGRSVWSAADVVEHVGQIRDNAVRVHGRDGPIAKEADNLFRAAEEYRATPRLWATVPAAGSVHLLIVPDGADGADPARGQRTGQRGRPRGATKAQRSATPREETPRSGTPEPAAGGLRLTLGSRIATAPPPANGTGGLRLVLPGSTCAPGAVTEASGMPTLTLRLGSGGTRSPAPRGPLEAPASDGLFDDDDDLPLAARAAQVKRRRGRPPKNPNQPPPSPPAQALPKKPGRKAAAVADAVLAAGGGAAAGAAGLVGAAAGPNFLREYGDLREKVARLEEENTRLREALREATAGEGRPQAGRRRRRESPSSSSSGSETVTSSDSDAPRGRKGKGKGKGKRNGKQRAGAKREAGGKKDRGRITARGAPGGSGAPAAAASLQPLVSADAAATGTPFEKLRPEEVPLVRAALARLKGRSTMFAAATDQQRRAWLDEFAPVLHRLRQARLAEAAAELKNKVASSARRQDH